jgi:methanogenic corrinoid protein MtbC1
MNMDIQLERFFEALINGNRTSSRQILREVIDEGYEPRDVIVEVLWPTYELIDRLFRSDQLSSLSHHLATRLLRVLVDQTAATFDLPGQTQRTVFAVSGETEADEMAAQMATDLLEADGFSVSFAGGGIPNDEIMAQVNENKPDVLLMFASGPGDLPNIRKLIDTLHEIGACPNLQIVVGGGVFNRAEGLAEEIGADLWATHPLDLVDLMIQDKDRRADETQRTVGRKRRRRAVA